jgi:hypothetical protein
MVAKTIVFYAGRGVFNINMGRLDDEAERLIHGYRLSAAAGCEVHMKRMQSHADAAL